MAPDVVERRTKGLEMYMTTIVRRFPDMLESPHLDRYAFYSQHAATRAFVAPSDVIVGAFAVSRAVMRRV